MHRRAAWQLKVAGEMIENSKLTNQVISTKVRDAIWRLRGLRVLLAVEMSFDIYFTIFGIVRLKSNINLNILEHLERGRAGVDYLRLHIAAGDFSSHHPPLQPRDFF